MTNKEIVQIFIERKKNIQSIIHGRDKELIISTWYAEARLVYNLDIHYNIFKELVYFQYYKTTKNFYLFNDYTESLSYRYKFYNRKFIGRNDLASKYVRKTCHVKKDKSIDDENKKLWKKNKHKHRGVHWRQSNCKKDITVDGNRAERRSTKIKLSKNDWSQYDRGYFYALNEDETMWDYDYRENSWDDYSDDKKQKWVNPWSWD